jgi:hypothetical protein
MGLANVNAGAAAKATPANKAHASLERVSLMGSFLSISDFMADNGLHKD